MVTDSSFENGPRLTIKTIQVLEAHDVLTTEQVYEQLSDEFDRLSKADVAEVLQTLEAEHELVNREEDSNLWYKQPPETELRNVVKLTNDLGLLDKQLDDDLEPIELLAHCYNLADWYDVQQNQRDTSLASEYQTLKQQLITTYEDNE